MPYPSLRPFVVVFFLLYALVQLYLFFRVRRYLLTSVQDLKRRRVLISLASAFFLLMLYPLIWHAIFGLRFYEPYPLAFRGLLAFWVVGSVGSAIMLLGYDSLRRLFPPRPLSPVALPDPQRRDFLCKSAGALLAAPFLVSGYGVFLGRQRFRVEEFDLPVNGLSSALGRLSVVHLTDIHVGPFMPAEELAGYVEAVNGLKPDLIALTGDFISSSRDEVSPCVHALAGLQSRYGIFACLGNHDVYAAAEDELTRLFGQHGITVLRDSSVSIQVGNTRMNILGIDDRGRGNANLSRVVRTAQREPGELRLLLSHRPEIFPEAAQNGIEVVLAGHYHGGQVKLWPHPNSLSIARFLTPYAEGLFHLSRRHQRAKANAKDAALFVGRGIGITALPVRINCPPQIAHLTLRNA